MLVRTLGRTVIGATRKPTLLKPATTTQAIPGSGPNLWGTATPVRAIAELWNQGMAAEEIPLHLPHVKIDQVFAALHYYLGHRDEIDKFIQANRIPEDLLGKKFDPSTGKYL